LLCIVSPAAEVGTLWVWLMRKAPVNEADDYGSGRFSGLSFFAARCFNVGQSNL
jgi:hypothetical protein